MFAVKAKIYGVHIIINPAPSLLMKHLVIGQRHKAPNFSTFHWSPHGSLVSIGQHFVNHEGSTCTEKDRNRQTEADLITESDHLCGPWVAAIAGSVLNQCLCLLGWKSRHLTKIA